MSFASVAKYRCTHCHDGREEHVGETEACLFSPTTFQCMTVDDYAVWFGVSLKKAIASTRDARELASLKGAR